MNHSLIKLIDEMTADGYRVVFSNEGQTDSVRVVVNKLRGHRLFSYETLVSRSCLVTTNCDEMAMALHRSRMAFERNNPPLPEAKT